MIKKLHNRIRFKLILLVYLSLSTIWAKQFTIINNKNLNPVYSQKNLLRSVKIIDVIHCLGECVKSKLCNLIVINDKMICNVYINMPLNNAWIIDSIGTNIYLYDNSQYDFFKNLVYYWPFNSYNGYKDLISDVTLTGSGSLSFVNDRFSNPSSALYLNKGWLSGPNRVYLTKSFTLSFWIRIREMICSIIISVNHLTFYHCGNIKILIDNSGPVLANSNTTLTLNRWQRLSYSYDSNSTIFSTYINGVCVYQGQQNFTQYLNLNTGSKFGYSYGWPLNGELSDIHIYNRALIESEIFQLSNLT